MASLEIRRLTPSLAADYFALFDLAARGITAVEAYPPARKPEDLSWEAASFKGPLSMYLSRGFEVTEREGRQVARRRL